MARVGAPLGSRNAAKGKEWLEAVRYALKRYETDDIKRGHALKRIALRVVEDALAGKPEAWREISERLDGKVSAGDGGSQVRVLVLRGNTEAIPIAPIDVESVQIDSE